MLYSRIPLFVSDNEILTEMRPLKNIATIFLYCDNAGGVCFCIASGSGETDIWETRGPAKQPIKNKPGI